MQRILNNILPRQYTNGKQKAVCFGQFLRWSKMPIVVPKNLDDNIPMTLIIIIVNE